MSSLSQRSTTLADRDAVMADRTSKLKAQLFELECLRDQVRQADGPPKNHRKRGVGGIGAATVTSLKCELHRPLYFRIQSRLLRGVACARASQPCC